MNTLDANGLTLRTRAEIIDQMKNGGDGFAGLFDIYGADINLDPNSPDGNLLNLIAQIAADYEELIASVYSSFDPDQAIGVSLDRDCAYNGIVRKAGTRSTQLVTVNVDRALTINGIDTAPDAPFTVSDASGNQFELLATHAFGAGGSSDLSFQAVNIGAVVIAPNSLTTIVTVQLGVVSVTNGVLAGTVGTIEESDAALRLRRQNSVENPSQGFLQGLIGSLLAIDSVTSAEVLENITNAVDANGIPAHSIWAIVAGGSDADVAGAIYLKRNAGCGMKGAVSVVIEQVDGSNFTVKFDRPTAETLWISLNAAAITGPAVDPVFIRAQIVANVAYAINQPADASAIISFLKSILPNVSFSAEGVSNIDGGYVPLKNNATVDKQWSLSIVRIYVNGAHG